MKIEMIPEVQKNTIKARDMRPGQIGRLHDAVDELYLVCQYASFLKIWPKSTIFETTSVVPANWVVELLPEGTVLKLTF